MKVLTLNKSCRIFISIFLINARQSTSFTSFRISSLTENSERSLSKTVISEKAATENSTFTANSINAPKNDENTDKDNLNLPVLVDFENESVSSSENEKEESTYSPKQIKSKLRQLKERMWVRETLEDLTAAEFATSLEKSSSQRKKGVDYEALLSKLDTRLKEMCIEASSSSSSDSDKSFLVEIEGQPCMLEDGRGMGCDVYTHDQREALFVRLLASRTELLKKMDTNSNPENTAQNLLNNSAVANLNEIRSQLQTNESSSSFAFTSTSSISSNSSDSVMLYVREDGTIDWDGALQDRAALKQFGSAVWARINGIEDPTSIENSTNNDVSSSMSHGNEVTAKIVETDALIQMKKDLQALEEEYLKMENEHTALLNSAIKTGSAVANVNLATLNPLLRAKIRSSIELLQAKKLECTIMSLNYELERIYTYLEAEMGNTFSQGYISLQDRLNVAEFGLLESQINTLNQQQSNAAFSNEIVDQDMLTIIVDQMTDFKRRLGIDYYVGTTVTYDGEAVMRFLNDLYIKSKNGVAFYVKGCQLLWNDAVFCTYLFTRALQGYTLKPREVNTLRRTIRDLITFVPVVIILIIPLTPIGHVLVFGAIQRFFPDFFPSCFTERRQNLLSLYESTEYSEITINETFREKVVRLLQAFSFFVLKSGQKLYYAMVNDGNELKEKELSPKENEKKDDDEAVSIKK